MTRAEALAAGLKVYFTGVPCKNGHLANRRVANWTCVVCHAEKAAEFLPKWREKNPKKNKIYAEKYADAHAASTKAWRDANKERCYETGKKWRQQYPEKCNEFSREWRSRNRDAMNALKAKRRADILTRLPKWLSSDEKWMIGQAYSLARLRTQMTGFDWHVDHVLPLRGRTVSGLHTPYNLQVIPAVENLRKGNSHGH
jgi:transcriptional regulator with AAA-type ATPase domain